METEVVIHAWNGIKKVEYCDIDLAFSAWNLAIHYCIQMSKLPLS